MTNAEGRPLDKNEIGDLGERLAALKLRREGCPVIYQNFRAPGGGEIDIICRDRETLVFVEVKTRTSREFGRPASAVNKSKQRLIIRGALEWLRLLHYPEIYFRFDIMEVQLEDNAVPELNRVENAFQMPDNIYYPGA